MSINFFALLFCFFLLAGAHEAINIGCLGDSITYGYCASPGNSYPEQLQKMLDPLKYKVENHGVSGTCILKNSDHPMWNNPGFTQFFQKQWDIIVVMFGTNDSKLSNFKNQCVSSSQKPSIFSSHCPFENDYSALISVLKTLGKGQKTPDIYLMVPPPLMQNAVYDEMNSTVVNDFYPILIRQIAKVNGLEVHRNVIDIFTAFGGESSWRKDFPRNCTLQTREVAGCKYFCDEQSCDECHPNDAGYSHLANTVKSSLMKSIFKIAKDEPNKNVLRTKQNELFHKLKNQ